MLGFDHGYAGLGRLTGRQESGEIRVNVTESHRAAPTARRRAAAAMSVAMMNGDVEAVVAALSKLGGRSSPQL
jgi:ribosomal 50S subunit-associated protein YjgA (DUF615 family)